MVAVTLTPTMASLRSAKPAYAYGASAYPPISNGSAKALVRVGMPADIPANAVISSAILTFTQYGAVSAVARTLAVTKNAVNWTMSKATWNASPGTTGAAVSVAKTGGADGQLWAFDVTADVAAYVAGTLTNYGWTLSNSTASTTATMRGSAAPTGQPKLTITYLTPTDAPIGLSPDGNQAVSVAKPWLTFQAPPDTAAINVQIDADATSPYDFDSGDVPAVAGQLDTSTTAWAGLTAGGASLYWRARTKSSYGYSAFSAWAQMRRVAKPTVAITSPGATADDTTPPIIWTSTGQVSWQVLITNAAGKIVADSGHIVGTQLTWTPPKAVATEGEVATVEVRVWDAVDRVATTNDPTYASAVTTFTAAGTGAVAGAATVAAVSDGFTPAVTVTATRGTAPDSWTIIRDGVQIAAGLATPLSYVDWTADPNKAHVYKASPYTNGVGKSNAATPTATVTPRCTGIWLIDPANPAIRAVIWGDQEASWDATELAIVHQPIAGPPVRRVAYRPPLSGSVAGELLDVGALLADDQITNLYDFKSNDRDLQLVLGDRNLTVRVGDLLVAALPDSDADRHSTVSFSWWQQGTTPWSP